MARIDNLIKGELSRNSIHEPVEASFNTFIGEDGQTYLQIDTYGSRGREMPGKKSQSIQFGPEGLSRLRDILAEL